MRRNFQIFMASLIVFSLFGILWMSNPVDADEQDYYLRLKKSWLHMQRVYENLNQHYVEEVDPYPLIKAGIDGMLDELDPYTVYIEAEGERRLQMITTGKYGGLGMEIGLRNKKVTIISPIENSPAKKMGIRAGDIIEKINGQDISDWSVDKVSKTLRGKVGTDVRLVIRRHGMEELHEMILTRAEIVIEDIGFAGFLEPGIAYISLIGFTDKASSELKAAIRKLKEKGKIEAFILDLRGNPGGLLESAVEVVNVFVEKNELVVYTKGYREKETKFYTRSRPMLPDVPLVVLVDNGSASASEIVAGALQDLDRAVIVGESTFGKGLVQKVYPIDKNDDVKLKITTARYYVPSGRCIQKRDYSNGKDIILRDSLLQKLDGSQEYFTRNKRKVLDKGGIYPDIELKGDSLSYIALELIRKSFFFDFTVKFHSENPNWDPNSHLPDSVMDEFNAFIKERNFIYDIEGSREIKKLEKIAENKGYSSDLDDLIQSLKNQLEIEKRQDYENSQAKIRKLLRFELSEKYLGEKETDRLALEVDDQVLEAINVLNNVNRYEKVLAIK